MKNPYEEVQVSFTPIFLYLFVASSPTFFHIYASILLLIILNISAGSNCQFLYFPQYLKTMVDFGLS